MLLLFENAPIQNVTLFQFRFLCFQNKSHKYSLNSSCAYKKGEKSGKPQVLVQNAVTHLFLLPPKGLIEDIAVKYWLVLIQTGISEIKKSKIKVASN